MAFRWIIVPALGIAAIGCGPSYKVVRQASPNPMNATSQFSVTPLVVDPAVKDDETKKKLIQCYEDELSSEGAKLGISMSTGSPFVVHPNLAELESSTIVVKETVNARMRVAITDAQGAELDVFTASVSKSKGYSSIAGAVADSAACQAGTALADAMVSYVKDRTGR
jgi:hypothetical protein